MVRHQGQEVALPRKEFELFALLASKPGRVFLRNEILEKVWGNDVIVGDRTIDVHVRKIRQKLNADYIHTVKGVGYKFEPWSFRLIFIPCFRKRIFQPPSYLSTPD